LQIGAEGGIPALVLYILFFIAGFANLRRLRKKKDLDPDMVLFIGALHSSLVGFVVGALFAPEAYQFFPFFAVAQTSAIWAVVGEREVELPSPPGVSKLSWYARRPSLSGRLSKPTSALR
jgi:hypothetical protein